MPYLDVFLIHHTHRLLRARHQGLLTLHGTMHIAQHIIIPALLQRTAQQPRILQIRERNATEALKAQMHEVEVLRDDGRSWAREVEREAVFDGAEVVELEDEVLGQVRLVAPDDPADTDVGEAELVAGGVDGDDTREAEVPFEFGLLGV